MPLFMSLLSVCFPFLFLLRRFFLFDFQQDLIEMLLFDVLWKISQNPRVYECLQRSQSGLRIDYQYLLKKSAKIRILDNRTQRFTGGNDGFSIFSFDDLGRKVLIEVFLRMFASLQVLLGRWANQPHDQAQLFLFILTSKERTPKMQLSEQASKTPNINGKMILRSQYNFRCTVEPGLDVQKIGLIEEHTGSKIDDFDAYLRVMLHQHVLRLQIAVDHSQFLEEGQRCEQLNGKGPYVMRIQWPKVIGLHNSVMMHMCFLKTMKSLILNKFFLFSISCSLIFIRILISFKANCMCSLPALTIFTATVQRVL